MSTLAGIHAPPGSQHRLLPPRPVLALRLDLAGPDLPQHLGMGGVDLRDLRGWRLVAPGGPPDGFPIDGRWTAERASLPTARGSCWCTTARPPVTITL
jgi:hypothetical protein